MGRLGYYTCENRAYRMALYDEINFPGRFYYTLERCMEAYFELVIP
jgi:hypothetical protein